MGTDGNRWCGPDGCNGLERRADGARGAVLCERQQITSKFILHLDGGRSARDVVSAMHVAGAPPALSAACACVVCKRAIIFAYKGKAVQFKKKRRPTDKAEEDQPCTCATESSPRIPRPSPPVTDACAQCFGPRERASEIRLFRIETSTGLHDRPARQWASLPFNLVIGRSGHRAAMLFASRNQPIPALGCRLCEGGERAMTWAFCATV